jgi:hypothetical protein
LYGEVGVAAGNLYAATGGTLDRVVKTMTVLAEEMLEAAVRGNIYLHSPAGLAVPMVLLATALRDARWSHPTPEITEGMRAGFLAAARLGMPKTVSPSGFRNLTPRQALLCAYCSFERTTRGRSTGSPRGRAIFSACAVFRNRQPVPTVRVWLAKKRNSAKCEAKVAWGGTLSAAFAIRFREC